MAPCPSLYEPPLPRAPCLPAGCHTICGRPNSSSTPSKTAEAFDELTANGLLVPDPARAESDYAEAYAWMLRQMDQRLPTSGASALWLWARRRREDLVGSCQLSPGRVLLTCRIPREHVLLSEFSDWHNVLNGFPNVYLLPDEAVEEYGDRLEAVLDWYESAAGTQHLWGLPRASWPPGLRGRLESSWEGIFEPASCRGGCRGRTDRGIGTPTEGRRPRRRQLHVEAMVAAHCGDIVPLPYLHLSRTLDA